MLYCHALPMVFLLFLYLIDLRVLVVGGGRTEFSVMECFGQALTWAWGGEGQPAMVICIAVTAVLCLSYGMRAAWRYKSDSWVLPVGLAIALPLLFVLVHPSKTLYVRYFIVSMIFLLVLISICLTSVFERGRSGRAICVLLIACYLAANGWYTWNLFSFGRGGYSDAVRYMQENSGGNVVTVGGNHPFRIPMILSFYGPLSQIPKGIRYFATQEWPAGGPEWLILQKPSSEPAHPASRVNDAAGHQYVLARVYPATPLSGLHLFIYHNTSRGE
jgi:hypothetical protein